MTYQQLLEQLQLLNAKQLKQRVIVYDKERIEYSALDEQSIFTNKTISPAKGHHYLIF